MADELVFVEHLEVILRQSTVELTWALISIAHPVLNVRNVACLDGDAMDQTIAALFVRLAGDEEVGGDQLTSPVAICPSSHEVGKRSTVQALLGKQTASYRLVLVCLLDRVHQSDPHEVQAAWDVRMMNAHPMTIVINVRAKRF